MASSSHHAQPYAVDEGRDDDEQDDLIDPDDATLDDLDDPLHPHSTSNPTRYPSNASTSHSTSSSAPLNPSYLTSTIPGEERSAPLSTLDETVWSTLSRDLVAIWAKLKEVLVPRHVFGSSMSGGGSGSGGGAKATFREAMGNIRAGGLAHARDELVGLAGRAVDVDGILAGGNTSDAEAGRRNGMSDGLRNWDLWGPLIFVLLLSVFLSAGARGERDAVFSGVFAMVWGGMAVVTGQIRLLGGNISFAQSICIIGYTLFPLVIASLLSMLHLSLILRIPIDILLVIWSLLAGVSILGGSGVVKNRVAIAVYPLCVFYVGLGTLCFIS